MEPHPCVVDLEELACTVGAVQILRLLQRSAEATLSTGRKISGAVTRLGLALAAAVTRKICAQCRTVSVVASKPRRGPTLLALAMHRGGARSFISCEIQPLALLAPVPVSQQPIEVEFGGEAETKRARIEPEGFALAAAVIDKNASVAKAVMR